MILETAFLVLDFFEGNREKTRAWFNTKNPGLGGVSPNDMIRMGRERKLYEVAKNWIEENGDLE